ncbi:hypothetical protein PP707_01715, partial [Acetobacter pasteurianus]|nr:hypothetical protein [Acetobacter pasteurianus]
MVQTVPTLQSSIFHHVTSLITSFISRNKNFFNPSFYQLFSFTKPTTEKEEIAEEELLAILDLVDLICQTNSSETTTLASNTCPKSTQLDTLLLILLGIDDQTIAETASKIFKWRITALSADDSKFDITWKVVFALQSSSLKIFHTQQAYILWLRYLNNSASNIASNKQFAELIQNDYYWSAIQIGLTSNLHEHRKYSLSILTMSIKSINLDFENKFVKWDTKEQDLYLNEWARYITLYEIIAVDTSLHQAEAGINDMTALISSNSRIFSSWGWALLSTGFKATIDSVRKFTMRLLLSIPLENLYLIKSALPILEKDILPNLMTASHLHVKTIDGVVTCAYVEKLQSFIMHMFQNLKDSNDIQNVAKSVLKVLVDLKDGFAPSRILVLQGMLQGLGENRKLLQYGGVHDTLLLELFDKTAEDEFHESYCQALNLRLLLHFEPNSRKFFELLAKFVKYNGYATLRRDWSLVLDYVTELQNDGCGVIDITDIDQQVLQICFSRNNNGLNTTNDLLQAKLLEAGYLQMSCENLANLPLLDNIEVIEALDRIEFKSGIDISSSIMTQLWRKIEMELQSADIEVLKDSVAKFKLFNKLFENSKYVFENPLEVFNFKNKLLLNEKEASKRDRFFYKLKDAIEGEYLTCLSTSYCKQPIDFQNLLGIFSSSILSLDGRCSMVKAIINYLQSNPEPALVSDVVAFLTEVWSQLASQRLNLIDRKLHLLVIEAMLHERIVYETREEKERDFDDEDDNNDNDNDNDNDNYHDYGQDLRNFCISVLENSKTRRTLLPALASCLSKLHISNTNKFESLDWMPEVLVKMYLVYQPKNAHFNLVNVLAEKFDKEIAVNKESSDIYKRVFGVHEISARIDTIALFNSINNKDFAQKIYAFIIENEKEFHLFNALKRTDAYEEWNRIQLYSIILSIVDQIDIDLNLFITRVATDPSPLVRLYIEWIIAYKMLQNPTLSDEMFNELTENYKDIKPTVCLSYKRILFLMIAQLERDTEVDYLSKYINVIIAGATAQKRLIRHFSLSMIISIWNEIERKDLLPMSLLEQKLLDPRLKQLVYTLYQTAVNSEIFTLYRSGDDLIWDIKRDL